VPTSNVRSVVSEWSRSRSRLDARVSAWCPGSGSGGSGGVGAGILQPRGLSAAGALPPRRGRWLRCPSPFAAAAEPADHVPVSRAPAHDARPHDPMPSLWPRDGTFVVSLGGSRRRFDARTALPSLSQNEPCALATASWRRARQTCCSVPEPGSPRRSCEVGRRRSPASRSRWPRRGQIAPRRVGSELAGRVSNGYRWSGLHHERRAFEHITVVSDKPSGESESAARRSRATSARAGARGRRPPAPLRSSST
jgi:hypothetical protein